MRKESSVESELCRWYAEPQGFGFWTVREEGRPASWVALGLIEEDAHYIVWMHNNVVLGDVKEESCIQSTR